MRECQEFGIQATRWESSSGWPFGTGTTPARGLTITIVANYLLNRMILQGIYIPWKYFFVHFAHLKEGRCSFKSKVYDFQINGHLLGWEFFSPQNARNVFSCRNFLGQNLPIWFLRASKSLSCFFFFFAYMGLCHDLCFTWKLQNSNPWFKIGSKIFLLHIKRHSSKGKFGYP